MSIPSDVSDASSGLPPPAKRAKVLKTPAFSEVTLDSVTLGGKSSHTPLLADGARVRFDLTPPGQLVFSNWGFETNYRFNPEKKPSFLGGPAMTKCLEMNLELTDAQAEFLQALDGKIAQEFAKAGKSTWHPAVKHNKDGLPMLKIRVQVSGDDLCALKVVEDGVFHKGSGWSFLQPFMDKTQGFGPCKAKAVVTAATIWEMAGRAGLSFRAAELTLMSAAKPRPQFESAQEDEAAMMADFD